MAINFIKLLKFKKICIFQPKILTILDSMLKSWCSSKIVFFLNNVNKKHVKKFLVI